MTKTVLAYHEKQKQLVALESQLDALKKELSAAESKKRDSEKTLFNTEIEEVHLLRKIWSSRKVNSACQRLDDEDGAPANVCEPASWHAEGLEQLRLEIAAALRDIYPTDEAEKLREKVESLRRTTKTLDILINATLPGELETTKAAIDALKSEIRKLDIQICHEAFLDAKLDFDKIAKPLIRRAFILANAYNPYLYAWGDPRFFFSLLFSTEKFPTEALLKAREKLREEIFFKR